MAALEIRLKSLIGELVPDAGWLADNVPSPPLETIIREYLFSLPARVPTSHLHVPKTALAQIKKGVTLRNKTAHVGGGPLDPDLVDDVLAAVQDLLWFCDYLAGAEWALSYTSPHFRNELGVSD